MRNVYLPESFYEIWEFGASREVYLHIEIDPCSKRGKICKALKLKKIKIEDYGRKIKQKVHASTSKGS